ncbi:MAG: preprotein translocase subunit SecG [Bacteroidetes bacterium]|nr:preprotein translocase subunit SecG [Bacteroidota bacterium]
MYTLLLTITIIASVLLVLIILMQSSKGEGLAGSIAGGANFGSVFGSRRTADFLSKASWWLGGAVIFLSIIINLFFLPGKTTQEQRESIIQRSSQQQVPASSALPAEVPAQESGTEKAE